MSLKKTIEHTVAVTVVLGASTATSTAITLPPGKIVAVVAFFDDYSSINVGFVRASIKDGNGVEVSQMQSIRNYRDREAGYIAGKKPLPMDGGGLVYITIQATANFSADFLTDFVFVYETEDSQNC